MLSILLLCLLAIGLVMGRRENFENPTKTATMVSPTLANLLGTPRIGEEKYKLNEPVHVDTLKREVEAVAAADAAEPSCPPPCPKCKTCPDMTQYIRKDEIPCWNCTL